jgi:hypothetical protein
MGFFLVPASSPVIYPPYSTSFPNNEDPISEGGKWKNGLTDGLDWADCKIVGGNVVSKQIYTGDHYNDATAILTGSWNVNHRAKATIFKNAPLSNGLPEVEIRLRSIVSGHVNTGYECLMSLYGLYSAQIVRWDGLDDFHYINGTSSSPVPVDGDVIEAEIIGGHIKLWLNNTLITEADDATYSVGNPGIGFYDTYGLQSENDKFGFKDFQAWEL